MDSLLSYRLSDFILFSETAYYRQFELYNQAIWPLHIVAIVFALVILYTVWRSPGCAGRVVSAILVTSWLWVAWAFLYERFYQIHVVADWYALGFVLQAGLITRQGLIKNRLASIEKRTNRYIFSISMLCMAVCVYPFIAVISGRDWQQFEMFTLAPDPTAIATIAILLLYKAPRALYMIPVIWIAVSGLTLYAM